MNIIPAIYERGVFRPTVPEHLPEGTHVNIQTNAEASLEPRDEWERGLLEAGRACGVSLSNSVLSSEGLYD